MTSPFHLKGPFGASYNVDGEDILRTKKALSQLGHFKEKKFVNEFADIRMIDGLKDFQRQRGLKADGVMKPDGPTSRELGKALVETDRRSRQRGILDSDNADLLPWYTPTLVPTRKQQHRPDLLNWAPRQPDVLKALAAQSDRTSAKDREDKSQNKDVQVAMMMNKFKGGAPDKSRGEVLMDLMTSNGSMRVLGAPATAAELFRQKSLDKSDGHESSAKPDSALGQRRTDMADPFPPVPPREPDDNRKATKTEFPADIPIRPATEIFPEPEERKAVLEGFPDQSNEIVQWIILENSRGNPETQWNTDYGIKLLDEHFKRWRLPYIHTHGGHSPEGKYATERYMKPMGGIGATRPDASFKYVGEDGKEQYEDLQTVDVLKDGKTLTARERRAEAKIREKKELSDDLGEIFSLAKSKGRDPAEWKSEARALVTHYFWRRYGPPPDAK